MKKLQKIDDSNAASAAAVMTKEAFNVIAAIFAENEVKAVKIQNDTQWFDQGFKERGYSSREEFLNVTGIARTEPAKKTRTRIDDAKRAAIVAAVQAGKSTDEIVTEFGVTSDSVYSIKSAAGLTVKRKAKAPVVVQTEPTTTVPVTLPIAA